MPTTHQCIFVVNKDLMIPKLYSLLLRVALIIALLPFIILCFYNQPYWDDLLIAASSRQTGIWQTQYNLFFHDAGGRFVSMFLLSAANPLTYGWWHGVKITALLFELATAATIFFGLRRLTSGNMSRSQAGWITCLLLLVYIAAIPDIHSSLYWFSGQVVHQIPMLLLIIIPVAVARAHQTIGTTRKAWLSLSGLGTSIVGGSSELGIILLALFLMLAIGLSMHRRQLNSLIIWGVLLIILGLTTGIHVAAPGNYVRLSASTSRVPIHFTTLLVAIGKSLRLVLWQPTALLLLAVPILFASQQGLLRQHQPAGLRLPLPIGITVLLIGLVSGITLMLTTIGGPPLLARAINFLLWWLLIGWCMACWAALPTESFPPVQHRLAKISYVLVMLLLVMTMAPVIRAWQEVLVDAPKWARQCDARLPIYAAASGHHGVLTVTPIVGVVPRYVLVRGYDIQPGPGHPLNVATAAYFRIDSVRTGGPQRPAF
ncbi:hypothetical protein [Hymenobacter daeguensis]